MELPVFAHAVLWQQAAPAPAPVLAALAAAPPSAGDRDRGPPLALVPDPEVGAPFCLAWHLLERAFSFVC